MTYIKFSEKEIRQHLAADEKITFVISQQTESTNLDAVRFAKNAAEEFTVILAESQKNGRGRLGRSFFSPENTGCYMSILLRPRYAGEAVALLTPLAAAATAAAIEKLTGKKADIKWINDIYIDGKKVAGILTQSAFTNEKSAPEYAVVGIGINIATPQGGFPQDIRQIAGALDTQQVNIKNTLVAELLNYFIPHYHRLEEKLFYEDYRKRLLWLGEEIRILKGDESFMAKMLDIDGMFHLIAEKDGEKLTLHSGEISCRRKQ